MGEVLLGCSGWNYPDTAESTETNAQVTVNNAFKFSQLTCNVTSISITGNSTVNLRKSLHYH